MEFLTALWEFSQGQEEFYRLNWYTFFSLISLPYPLHEVSVLIFSLIFFILLNEAQTPVPHHIYRLLNGYLRHTSLYMPCLPLPSPLLVLNLSSTPRTPNILHCIESVPFIHSFILLNFQQDDQDILSYFPNLHYIT